MDSNLLETAIDHAERKVLLAQLRIFKQKEQSDSELKRLESEAKSVEEMKEEWLRKRNEESERIRMDRSSLTMAHRHAIEDLRTKFEKERADKLRDLKVEIEAREAEIREWQLKRSQAVQDTRTKEDEIKLRYQQKINTLLREETYASRRGVVRQKRLLDAPDVFTMTLEKEKPVRMKKRTYGSKRMY